ncbi:MAG: linear amide C-N hydrolase [Bacteriovoracaceae bacterium]|nr:linear amide C-N hydrolase [Bacteriovoracaceae bacterium]
MFNNTPVQPLLLILCTFCWALLTPTTLACTAFFSKTHKIIGKSYDWSIGTGIIVVNKRDFNKTALNHGFENPVSWTSNYGSVTFNQHGREFPVSGINEKGLVIEVLWLSDTIYPAQTDIPQINELQWVQYQLDNFQNVDEVVANIDKLQIAPMAAAVHYLVCDHNRCAVVEFLKGQTVVSQNAVALANDTFEDSETTWNEYAPQIDVGPFVGLSSLGRYLQVRYKLSPHNPNPPQNIGDYFDILQGVWTGNFSKWNIIYDLQNQEISYRIAKTGAIKKVALEQFDFSCLSKVSVINLNNRYLGDISENFSDYTREINFKQVKSGMSWIESSLPPGSLQAIALYPEQHTCNH